MRLVLATCYAQCHIAESFVVEQIAQIFGQFALGHLELNDIALAGDVDAVRHDADLTEYRQFVLGQQTVRLVQQEVASDEFLEAPILALNESVRSVIKGEKMTF